MRELWISTDPTGCGHKFWFRLYIYDTVAQLQEGAIKYSNEGRSFWEGAAGCFQPRLTVGYKNGEAIRTRKTSFIGVMRLCKPYLTREVVVHESVHAGINLVRAMALDSEVDFGEIQYEEALAFAVQEISGAILRTVKVRKQIRWRANDRAGKEALA